MSYSGSMLVAVGTFMVLLASLRLRSLVNEGLYEFHAGRICKVSRIEQPRGYWSRIFLMLSTCGTGLWVLWQATALLHR